MSTKHNPGTWKLESTITPDGSSLLVMDDEGTSVIADCAHEHGIENCETAEANARLIAAAPDLLEACKGMIEWARRVQTKNPGMEIVKAIAAIARAEGGEA